MSLFFRVISHKTKAGRNFTLHQVWSKEFVGVLIIISTTKRENKQHLITKASNWKSIDQRKCLVRQSPCLSRPTWCIVFGRASGFDDRVTYIRQQSTASRLNDSLLGFVEDGGHCFYDCFAASWLLSTPQFRYPYQYKTEYKNSKYSEGYNPSVVRPGGPNKKGSPVAPPKTKFMEGYNPSVVSFPGHQGPPVGPPKTKYSEGYNPSVVSFTGQTPKKHYEPNSRFVEGYNPSVVHP